MILDLLLIIVGLTLVVWGADKLTEGASSLARGMKVPEMVIGLTIVAAGTSAPELFVSMVSALKGTPDMAVANVVGSNVFNTLCIVGCSAVVAPMTISPMTVKKDMPFSVVASLLLFILAMDDFSSFSLAGHDISRLDSLVLLGCFIFFMGYNLRIARRHDVSSSSDTSAEVHVSSSPLLSLCWVAIGLACLIVGSNLFVDHASAVAQQWGVSDRVIGLTIVAGGTSMPELATSVVAAMKGRSAIAIGNVIGSNVFNVFAILGLTAMISPLHLSGISFIDMMTLSVSILLVWWFSFTKFTVSRLEGLTLILIFSGYMVSLFV